MSHLGNNVKMIWGFEPDEVESELNEFLDELQQLEMKVISINTLTIGRERIRLCVVVHYIRNT